MDRWERINTIAVDASITGATWWVKGQGDALKDVHFEVDTRTERLAMDLIGQDKRSIFEPHRVVIERADGSRLDARNDPERSFDGHEVETPWDDVHVAYFSGQALWTYLNTPFLYSWPGFHTQEISPIEVDGEAWRRLKVRFPDYIKSHTHEQIFCFGPDGLLRRHDYTVDILGGARGLNYASDYRDVDGIVIPTTRHVYPWEGDYQRVAEPVLIAIDMDDITLH
jgi:hypothetical protein